MKNNVLAIGVSHRDYFSIMMAYYPKDIDETFDIVLFVDNRNNILQDIKDLIEYYNVPIFKRAKIVIIEDLLNDCVQNFNPSERAKKFLFEFAACFKLFVPIYLKKHYNVQRVFAIDDDIFILRDLSPFFEKYKGWAFKKETLFNLKTKNKQDIINEFNSMLDTSFELNELNSLSLNSGTIMYDIDDMYTEYVKRFIENTFAQDLFFNNDGFSAWTVEQRFQHFNMHRLLKERDDTLLFQGSDVRLITGVGDDEPGQNYLKQTIPYIIHYTLGVKKPLWLRKFLPGIAWRFDGYVFHPKFELKDILYNENWKPLPFKLVHKKQKVKANILF